MKKNFIRLFWLPLLISISYQLASIEPSNALNLNAANNANSTEIQIPEKFYKTEFVTILGLTALAAIFGTGTSLKHDK